MEAYTSNRTHSFLLVSLFNPCAQKVFYIDFTLIVPSSRYFCDTMSKWRRKEGDRTTKRKVDGDERKRKESDKKEKKR